MRVSKLAGLCALFVAGACAAQARPALFAASPLSVPNTEQLCLGTALKCFVYVRVEPKPITIGGKTYPCTASIDVAKVSTKRKNMSVYFVLVKSDMSDAGVYAFTGQGIGWDGPGPSDPREFKFMPPLQNSDTLAEWYAGTKKSRDLNYLPTVKRTSTNEDCGAGDPVIANDG